MTEFDFLEGFRKFWFKGLAVCEVRQGCLNVGIDPVLFIIEADAFEALLRSHDVFEREN